MNFLAHIYLSCDDPDLLIGNFIADFISPKEAKLYPSKIRKGIKLHRIIDSFTDNHPDVRQSNKRLRHRLRKYAPVAVDVLYDHLLARNWSDYSDEDIDVFANRAYGVFQNRFDEFPESVQYFLPKFIEHKFLQKYATLEGLERSFNGMNKRARFQVNFLDAIEVLNEEYHHFNQDFNSFFPDMIEEVQSHLSKE